MKKKLIIVDVFSFLVLITLTIVINYNGEQRGAWIPLSSALVMIIPVLYSFIPLIKEHLLEIKRRENRLSDLTFTDRDEDVKDILKKLTTTEHIIQIKGNSQQCGKTWLAKRICDCINFPKELNCEYKKYLRFPYYHAAYIDMDEKPDSYLDVYFQEHAITPKHVLIFDHVSNLSAIFSKQEIFHFQLIYVLKEEKIIDPFSHLVTNFGIENIKELHQKIQKYYPAINCITQEEISVLYNLTGGNIGKIYSLLSREEYITWLKDIAQNQSTDYDKKLNIISADLYSGNYEEAERKLELFQNEFNDSLMKNNDLLFKYCIIKSDCEHLLNRYDNALSTLSILSTSVFAFENKDYKLELYQAHYYKHLWKCNDALNTLKSIQMHSISAMTDAFGILLAKYFINDLTVPYSANDSLTEFINLFKRVENINVQPSDNEKNKINRYRIFYEFYLQKPADEGYLIGLATNVIDSYNAQNNRLLANAYFLRGEIYRLYQKYDLAERDYEQSILITKDDNIRIQVNIIRQYIFTIKKIDIDPRFELLSKESIIQLCKNKNKYGEKLFHRINCIELGDVNASEIDNCFKNRIMPIL